MARVEIYGIRHHGPGSARALRRALEEFRPDVVLIEGPPEADAIVGLAADPGMRPPVALLAYAPETAPGAPDEGGGRGRRAAFWPFAEFSPEWQAIRHAVEAGVPVRFCDLPAAHRLADHPEFVTGPEEPGAPSAPEPDGHTAPDDPATPGTPAPGGPPVPGAPPAPRPDGRAVPGGPGGDAEAEGSAGAGPDGGAGAGGDAERIRLDPLGWLARVAGYDDAERWWEDVVEHRGDGPSPFPAIAEAMTALREELRARPVTGEHALPEAYVRRERQREAYMRRTLRRAVKDGYERVAVVCGAWHVPALRERVPASRDDQVLRGLPKEKVTLTWVPWTHGRLAHWSGYGAGVRSPGWYHHLFTSADRPVERWLTGAARLLREEDLHVSSAHVIEAVRLAETLAALRDRPLAGLEEVTEATLAVLCEGAEAPLGLIERRMVVGERLGAVPGSTPMVPLQRDLQAAQRRLRLKPSALPREHDLDLRRPLDLDRSRLLHRLRLLGVAWGAPEAGGGRSTGTFRESWTLTWRPEFDVDLIEAGVWGTTVAGAADARARALAAGAGTLAELTSLAERCLLADLGGALPAVMRALADLAAADADAVPLMAALPALVRALRYGDVRGTPTGPLRTVVDGLVVRICVGLPAAASALDEDAARELLEHVGAVHETIALLDVPDQVARWQGALAGLLGRPGLHGLVDGRLTRLLHDAGRLDDVADRMARAVSVGAEPARAAAWVEGFLAGGGLLLVHDDELLRLVDEWITGLPAASFTDVLPLLRRTFGRYAAPERRAIGERARRLGTAGAAGPAEDDDLDPARARPAALTAARILGRPE